MNQDDAPAHSPDPQPPYDARPLRVSSSPPMWNDRARGMRGGGSSSLAPKAPYYISGAILLVAIVIVAFAVVGADGQPITPGGAPIAPAGAAGNPIEPVTAAVQQLLAKPLIDDCTKAD